MPIRPLSFIPRRSRGFESLEKKTLLCNAYGTSVNSFVFVGDAANAGDCAEIELAAGDVLNVRLELDAGVSPNSVLFEPLLQMVDGNGTSVIGADKSLSTLVAGSPYEAFLPTNPMTQVTDLLRGGDASFVFHVGDSGTYTISANQNSISPDSASMRGFTVTGQRFRPAIESRPYGSRQYLYINFDGGVVDTSQYSSFNHDEVHIDAISTFLDNVDRGGVTGADADEFSMLVAQYIEEQFPIWKGRVLTSATPEFSDAMLDSNVSVLHVGQNASDANGNPLNLSFDGRAQWEDQGNQALNDTGFIKFGAGTMLNLATVQACQVQVDCGTDFFGQTYSSQRDVWMSYLSAFVGNIVAHEAGHMLGATHVNKTDQARAVMVSENLGPTKLLYATGNKFVGKTNENDLEYGAGDNLLVDYDPQIDDLIFSDYYFENNDQVERVNRVLAAIGREPGFWYSYRDAVLNGADIVAGELVYTGDPNVAEDVEVARAGNAIVVTVNGGTPRTFNSVTGFRFIGKGGGDTLYFGAGGETD